MAYTRKESSCIGCVEDRIRIDRFFELVAERIASGQVTSNGDHTLTEIRSLQCGGRK